MAEPSRLLARELREADPSSEAESAVESKRGKNVAVISIAGVVVKGQPLWGDEVSSTETAALVRRAANDSLIDGILLVIDSPGGMASGTEELASEVFAASKVKPLFAIADGMAASAAYWVASQAARVYALNRSTLVGSIGTYLGLYDFSEAFENAGIKPVLISSGGVKGVASFMGAEITDEAKTELQRIVNGTQSLFDAGVSRGRGIPIADARALADGRIHLASDALELGLIDDIASLSDVLSALGREIDEPATGRSRSASARKGKAMANDDASRAATFEELALIPGVSNDFICEQLKTGATFDQASSAWMEAQQAENAGLASRVEALESSVEALSTRIDEVAKSIDGDGDDEKGDEDDADDGEAKSSVGVKPLGRGGSGPATDGTDARADWHEAIRERVAAGASRSKAIRMLNKERPELRRAYVEAANAER